MIKKSKEKFDLNYIYQNNLNKVCFVHNTAYPDSKDVAKRTILDKVLNNRACRIVINPKNDGY